MYPYYVHAHYVPCYISLINFQMQFSDRYIWEQTVLLSLVKHPKNMNLYPISNTWNIYSTIHRCCLPGVHWGLIRASMCHIYIAISVSLSQYWFSDRYLWRQTVLLSLVKHPMNMNLYPVSNTWNIYSTMHRCCLTGVHRGLIRASMWCHSFTGIAISVLLSQYWFTCSVILALFDMPVVKQFYFTRSICIIYRHSSRRHIPLFPLQNKECTWRLTRSSL